MCPTVRLAQTSWSSLQLNSPRTSQDACLHNQLRSTSWRKRHNALSSTHGGNRLILLAGVWANWLLMTPSGFCLDLEFRYQSTCSVLKGGSVLQTSCCDVKLQPMGLSGCAGMLCVVLQLATACCILERYAAAPCIVRTRGLPLGL